MPTAPHYGISWDVQFTAIVVCAVLAAASLAYCVVRTRRDRSPLPLYLFAAGALTVFFEPYPDLLGAAVFPEVDQVPWISTFGRMIPMYIGLTYMFYWAPAWLAILPQFQRGLSTRRFWTICATMLAATCAIELVPLHFGLWTYYGEQPFRVGGFPLWWAFINGHSFIASAVILVLLLRVLPKNRQFLIIPVMPAVVLGTHTAGAMVGFSTVSSTSNSTITTAGTLGAMAFTVLLCWIYSLFLCAKPELEPHPNSTTSASSSVR
ncbi:hypothetical protein MANY_39110 [Mycolicibacterium anyangense]|uniref:Uncharacterized protein n=1 Tax=Mycolicibacterium anyangense TaxID=1431246 RepID=A0A6N4WEP9_9MYCO|nr:hypothetical protein [Mycolicibacterium anyangense]BBZ78574.1 hypothetical protein MANY_39110 [Mycolicibacterium anyangense]